MLGLQTLLGKRPAASNPIGSPTASGTLPDDVEGPPAAKLREEEVPDRTDDIKRLTDAVSLLTERLSGHEQTVTDMQRKLTAVQGELAAERTARQEVEKELSASTASLARFGERMLKMQADVNRVGKSPAYADVVGRDATAELRRQQQLVTDSVGQLKQQVEQQDRQARAANVMIFGLAESAELAPLQQVTACLQAVDAPEQARVVRAVRLGQQRGNGPRPVKVEMQSAADAAGLLRLTKQLRERQRVRLDRDLTLQQAELRKSRLGAASRLRDLGYVTYFNAEQLIYVQRGTGRRSVFNGTYPEHA